MQTIIMTVGTSLLTNPDKGLEDKRPWLSQTTIGNHEIAIDWMEKTDLELISAETNTIWRIDPHRDDEIMLLHSDTTSGLECAQVLQAFFQKPMGQTDVSLHKLPEVNYALENSALERMAQLLQKLIDESKGNITLAATGGFKAQTMVMGLVGNNLGIPVCYVHELYKALVYLPYLSTNAQATIKIKSANLPHSGVPRTQILHLQDKKQGHHRPKVWDKVAKMLTEISWIDYVRFDDNAFSAPKNGIKSATRSTNDGRHILWMHLHESDQKHIAVSIETTGYTLEHLEQAAAELRERLGRLI